MNILIVASVFYALFALSTFMAVMHWGELELNWRQCVVLGLIWPLTWVWIGWGLFTCDISTPSDPMCGHCGKYTALGTSIYEVDPILAQLLPHSYALCNKCRETFLRSLVKIK